MTRRLYAHLYVKGDVKDDVIRFSWLDTVDLWRYVDLSVTVDWSHRVVKFSGKGYVILLRIFALDTNAGDVYVDHITTNVRDVYGGVGPLTVQKYAHVDAAVNDEGLICSVNNDYRQLVQFRATLGAAGEIRLEASPNGTDWFTLWSKTLDEADSYCDWDFVAFPYFRVYVPTTGIDITIDVRAVYV